MKINKNWPSQARDTLLCIMGIVSIALAINLTLSDKLPAAGTLFTAGLLLCLFSNLSRFESIKGMGVEAKMVALGNKLNEAEQLLKHMRAMVDLMADTSFHIIGNVGRWDAEIPKPTLLRIVTRFQELLAALGEPDDSIAKKLAPWHQNNILELAHPIQGAVHKFVQFQNQVLTERAREPANSASAIDTATANEKYDCHTKLLRLTDRIFASDIGRFSEEVEHIIQSSGVGTFDDRRWLLQQLTASIEDLRHYLKHRDFRNLTEWINRPYGWEIVLDFTECRSSIGS